MNSSIDNLINSIGQFIEYWGFKPIHGKIWTYIYLMDRPISSRELKDKFKISKALLSMTLNDLKTYNVIIASGKGTHGAECFIANPNIFEAITNVLKDREMVLIENIEDAIAKLTEFKRDQLVEAGLSPSRFKSLTKIVNSGKKMIKGIVKLDIINLSKWKDFK